MQTWHAVAAAAAAAVVLLVVWRAFRHSPFNTAAVVSADGATRMVHGGFADGDAAAEALMQLDGRVRLALAMLRRRFKDDPGPRGAFTRKLLANFNPDRIVENSPLNVSGDTAFTLNKGTLLALCLRRPDRAVGDPAAYRVHDIDLLTFVTLHELTHMGLDAYDHPPEFWQAFKLLLATAVAAGALPVQDFREQPEVYCGLKITYNPLLDPTLPFLGAPDSLGATTGEAPRARTEL